MSSRQIFLDSLSPAIRWYFDFCIYINQNYAGTHQLLKIFIKLLPVIIVLYALAKVVGAVKEIYYGFRYDVKELRKRYSDGENKLRVKRRGKNLLLLNPKKRTEEEWRKDLEIINSIAEVDYDNVRKKRKYVEFYKTEYPVKSWGAVKKMRKAYELVFGFDENGSAYKLLMRTQAYFIRVYGAGGSGKSVLINFILRQIINEEVDEIYIFDGKGGVDFNHLRNHPKVTILNPLKIEDAQKIIKMMREIFEQGRRFTDEMAKLGHSPRDVIEAKEKYPDVEIVKELKIRAIIAEEAPQYLTRTGATPEQLEMINLFQRHLELNRYLNNYFICCSQSANQEGFGLRNNLFPVRVSSRLNNILSNTIHNDGKIANQRDLVKGRFIISSESGVKKIQSVYIDENDFTEEELKSHPQDISRKNERVSVSDENEDYAEARTAVPLRQNKNGIKNDVASPDSPEENTSSPPRSKKENESSQKEKITIPVMFMGRETEIKINNKALSQGKLTSSIQKAFKKLERDYLNEK